MNFKNGYSSFELDEFQNNSGDGKEVPQFYLDEKNKVIKPKFDKDGNQVYHSLYDDIQKNRNANDYKKALVLNPDMLKDFSPDWEDADVSEFGDFETINKAFNKVQEVSGKNVFDLIEEYKTKLVNDKLKETDSVKDKVKKEISDVKGESK